MIRLLLFSVKQIDLEADSLTLHRTKSSSVEDLSPDSPASPAVETVEYIPSPPPPPAFTNTSRRRLGHGMLFY